MQTAIPATLMRGGTSRGLYFRPEHLPGDPALRDQVLLRLMGSPDTRQIDGAGGAHPLTSKVAIVSRSEHSEADVDYLFLQVAVDHALVSDGQNCGNILAGVAPFAIEQGMIEAQAGETDVRIRMVNSGGLAVARVQTPGGVVTYDGFARIDGVPGTAAPVSLDFQGIAGANCGALLPTGNVCDNIDGTQVTCIDNGMPVVVINAQHLGRTGSETPAQMEADKALCAAVESLRIQAGELMNLGDVRDKTMPKMSLVAAPSQGGALSTRTFIPQRVHEAIGVLGAVSVATACLLEGSVAAAVAQINDPRAPIEVEHPTGSFSVEIELSDQGEVKRAALLRTARRIMQGEVYLPASVWPGNPGAPNR